MNLPKDPIVVANRAAKRESLLRAARVNPEMSALQLSMRVGCNRVTAVEWLKEAGLARVSKHATHKSLRLAAVLRKVAAR